MGDATSRRSEREVLEFDGLRIETNARRVSVDGVEVALTKTEFDLLELLATNAGNLITSAHIYESVWGTDWIGDGHAVEVQISRLSRKLRDSAGNPRFIEQVCARAAQVCARAAHMCARKDSNPQPTG